MRRRHLRTFSSFGDFAEGPIVLSEVVRGRGEIGGDLIDVQPKLDMSRADFEVLPAFGVVLSAIVCCSQDFLFS